MSDFFCNFAGKCVYNTMIPKIIHYCWYGRGEKSAAIKMCIESWKQYCPDYEIREWNEDNSLMDIRWMRDAYKHRKFAFVADYARFYALYHEGGVYMDTDMLLVKPIDEFLSEKCFMGREDRYNVNMAILGAEKGDLFCKQCLDYYDAHVFDMVKPPIITRFITPLLEPYGLVEDDTTQHLEKEIVVYKSDYFYPIHYTQEFEIQNVMDFCKPDTYGIHLWNKSWTDEFKLFEAGEYKLAFAEVRTRLRRTPILPFSYWKKVIKYTGRYLGLWKR